MLPLSLHTLTTYRERERGLWRYFYKTVRGEGPGAQATKLYGDLLPPICIIPTPMTTTTTTAAAAATAFKYYHHSLITLSHPLRLRPLLLQTHDTQSSFLSPTHETNISLPNTLRDIFSFPHLHRWQHCFFFKSPANTTFFKSPAGGEGSHVTAEVEGVILFLRKSLPPPEQTAPDTTHVAKIV